MTIPTVSEATVTLMVGLRNGTVTSEDTLVVTYKTKYALIICTTIILISIYSNEFNKIHVHVLVKMRK